MRRMKAAEGLQETVEARQVAADLRVGAGAHTTDEPTNRRRPGYISDMLLGRAKGEGHMIQHRKHKPDPPLLLNTHSGVLRAMGV